MTKYSLATIRKKALNAGYRIEKGFQHYHYNNAVFTNWNGERFTGFNVFMYIRRCRELLKIGI